MDHYDPESGQIYRETLVKHRPLVPWEHRCSSERLRSEGFKRRPRKQGAERLTDMAMRQIVRNAKTLEPKTVQAIPEILAKRVWEKIRQEGQESLHIWKAFVSGGCGDSSMVYSKVVRETEKPLVNYFLDITSSSHAWMVDLTLSDFECSTLATKQLAVICNLQNLQVIYTNRTPFKAQIFTDGLLSNMAWRASKDGAFSRLRTILLQNAQGITHEVFKCLSRFPKLDTYCVLNTAVTLRHVSAAKSLGWNLRDISGFISCTRKQKVQNSSINLDDENTFQRFQDFATKHVLKRGKSSPPILDILFGKRNHGYETNEQLSHILCFDRNWDFNQPEAGKYESASPAAEVAKDLRATPAAKVRKLRDAKMQDLGVLLEEY